MHLQGCQSNTVSWHYSWIWKQWIIVAHVMVPCRLIEADCDIPTVLVHTEKTANTLRHMCIKPKQLG